jgi:probable F420-dependent oxidoreductase
VEIGVVTFMTDRGRRPAELALAVEQHGLDALFVTEHTHLPVDPGPTPWGAPPGEEYGRTLDPFVALTAAATVTDRITLGTAVTLIAQHDPIVTAKVIASIDHLSHGRLLVGVGYGWCRPEAEDHGIVFDQRRQVVAEHVAAMRALWQSEPTAFHGEHVRFGPSHAHPKPVNGAVPIYLGAPLGAVSRAHLREWADGWMPSDRPTLVEDLERLTAEVGPVATTVVGASPTVERLDQLAAAGVERVVLWLPPWPEQDIERALDAHAELARRFRG